ncbi:ATP-binding protein [Nonomuraea sp. NPDC050394]|uniref:ATP-binding protein n=1 Tax=Nonomuraea sp. NPDC050394 TaxID=3364363 RepID=UPI00379040D4
MDADSAEPFGPMLRRLRERAGLTQEQLAERAGISTNAVSALERGVRSRPYRHTRDALAAALGITAVERAAWEGALSAPVFRPRLPAAASPILGREPQIDLVLRRLSTERVVTLTGPGGVGKTRLALAVSERIEARFADGVIFVPLAALQEGSDVLPAIAHAVGLRELGPRDVREVLAGHLRARRALLVLDNAEHVPDAAGEAAALMIAATAIVVLVTSRAPLRIHGEHVHPVPLLTAGESGALFAARAAQASGHPLDDGDRSVVAELCARLDHLPLAIELVAARTRLLTPVRLLAHLDALVLGTAGGPRDVPAHQRTLRDTVRWSYDLLDEAARTLLRHLAGFSGGWTLPAAMAVGELSETEALDLHATLLDNSLIVRDTASGEPRFRMLETIRAVVLEHLSAPGEADRLRERHARYFCDRMTTIAPLLWDPRTAEALDELASDHENLRAAMRHLLAGGALSEVAAACAGSWLYWVVRGHLRDPLHWARTALGPGTEPAVRARLQYIAGWSLLPRGHHDEAARWFEAAAGSARDAAADAELAWILLSWAHAEVYRGRPEPAAELLASASAALDGHSDVHALSCVAIGYAHVAIAGGSMTEADALLAAQLPDIEARGAQWPIAVALGIQGRVAAVLGDHARAAKLLDRSVRIFGELQDTWGMAHQLTHLADAAALQGDHTRAALLYGAVDELAHEVGAQVFHVWQELSDRCQADVMSALGVDRCTRLRRRGRLLSVAQVVELATGSRDAHTVASV